MNNQKSNLEIWLMVEWRFDLYFQHGICGVILLCIQSGDLTEAEGDIAYQDLKEYGRKRWNIDPADFRYWETGHKKPRVMFIQKMIMKYLKVDEVNEHEVWIKVRDNLSMYFVSGLCGACYSMYQKNILSSSEFNLICMRIEQERKYLGVQEALYFWEVGVIELRQIFINKMLGVRSPLELWKVVKSNFNNIFDNKTYQFNTKGLCGVIGAMERDKIINLSEYRILMHHLEDWGKANDKSATFYYWPKGNKSTRLIWINRTIEYYERKQNSSGGNASCFG